MMMMMKMIIIIISSSSSSSSSRSIIIIIIINIIIIIIIIFGLGWFFCKGSVLVWGFNRGGDHHKILQSITEYLVPQEERNDGNEVSSHITKKSFLCGLLTKVAKEASKVII